MFCKHALLSVGVVLLLPLLCGGQQPLGGPAGLPVGKWKVEFTNGVRQASEFRRDGTGTVLEPLRESAGKAEVKAGVVVITFADDRAERWTPVNDRFVVEHWFPASAMTTGAPVLGIAERAP